jgi:hypothetical protein
MFYTVTRKNYKVNAETEAKQIKESTGAYKVEYIGSRLFMVYESPEAETLIAKFNSMTPTNDTCTCWK